MLNNCVIYTWPVFFTFNRGQRFSNASWENKRWLNSWHPRTRSHTCVEKVRLQAGFYQSVRHGFLHVRTFTFATCLWFGLATGSCCPPTETKWQHVWVVENRCISKTDRISCHVYDALATKFDLHWFKCNQSVWWICLDPNHFKSNGHCCQTKMTIIIYILIINLFFYYFYILRIY